MYYTLERRRPTALAQASEPQYNTIFGVRADSFLRVALPIVAGGFGAAAIIYGAIGRSQTATVLAVTSATMTLFITGAQAIRAEQRGDNA